MTAIGYGHCVDCGSTQELTQHGDCSRCGSGSIAPRRVLAPTTGRGPDPALMSLNVETAEDSLYIGVRIRDLD